MYPKSQQIRQNYVSPLAPSDSKKSSHTGKTEQDIQDGPPRQ